MARKGVSSEQMAFHWGNRTTVGIDTLISSSSGDLIDGDLVYDTDVKTLKVFRADTLEFGGMYAQWLV